jgi:hypothetical protein
MKPKEEKALFGESIELKGQCPSGKSQRIQALEERRQKSILEEMQVFGYP